MDIVNSMILPIILTSAIIYLWLKVFHEYTDISKILIVATIANFQNYIIPLIVNIFLRLGITIFNPFLIVSALLWIVIIKIIFKEISISHAIIIGILCFATHTFFEIYNPLRVIISYLK